MKRKKEWFEKPFPTELKVVLAILAILVFFNEPWFIPVLCIMGIGAAITMVHAIGVGVLIIPVVAVLSMLILI